MNEGVFDLNFWIQDNQALVAAIGLPILTLIVTTIISLTTTRANLSAQTRQRQLGRDLKWAEFRREYIEDLRKDVAEFIRLAAEANATTDGTKAIYSARSLRVQILLKIPIRRDFYDVFSDLSAKCLEASDDAKFAWLENEIIDCTKDYIRHHWDETRSVLKLETEWT